MLKKNLVKKPEVKKPAAPVKKLLGKQRQADPEPESQSEAEGDPDPEPEEQPKRSLKKKGSGGGQSLADLFDATKARSVFSDFPEGEHRAIISLEMDGEIAENIEDQEDLTVKAIYEGLEDEAEGKSITNQYRIFKDGEFNENAVGFLKKDLDTLGYEDIPLADLAELCEQVTNEQPQVVVMCKQNGQYKNVYLQGLAD